MSTQLTAEMSLEFREVEPDGQECLVCKKDCTEKVSRLFYRMNSGDWHPFNDLYTCDACGSLEVAEA